VASTRWKLLHLQGYCHHPAATVKFIALGHHHVPTWERVLNLALWVSSSILNLVLWMHLVALSSFACMYLPIWTRLTVQLLTNSTHITDCCMWILNWSVIRKKWSDKSAQIDTHMKASQETRHVRNSTSMHATFLTIHQNQTATTNKTHPLPN
jgi:hypothetical protein